eukprot:augustus_masked-scaffold_3-processed-gene-6.56-mRNA-1 protein AED:0.03 eAED:0.03 QI:0/-1/0/1/-1/1/1/0/218
MNYGGRVNSAPGSGGLMTREQENAMRKERQRKLAMETMDLSKDPYFIKNHHGVYECRLCTTLHKTEANYLAHTQGRKHRSALQKRAQREAQSANNDGRSFSQGEFTTSNFQVRKDVIKIGKPGYKCFKALEDGQNCLIFEILYPQITNQVKPLYRIMSPYEQQVEDVNPDFQYLVFAAEPYQNIAFKIPNKPIDRRHGKLQTTWDTETKAYTLKLLFR